MEFIVFYNSISAFRRKVDYKNEEKSIVYAVTDWSTDRIDLYSWKLFYHKVSRFCGVSYASCQYQFDFDWNYI